MVSPQCLCHTHDPYGSVGNSLHVWDRGLELGVVLWALSLLYTRVLQQLPVIVIVTFSSIVWDLVLHALMQE